MNKILSYLTEVNAQKQINHAVKKYQNKRVVLYGAGLYFQILMENFDLSGLNIVAICDKKFETLKSANPSQYLPIAPAELAEFEYDIILSTLYDDTSLMEYLAYELLVNTKNEGKEISSLIEPSFGYILKNSSNKIVRKKLCSKYEPKWHKNKRYYDKVHRTFVFMKDIADDEALKHAPEFSKSWMYRELKRACDNLLDAINVPAVKPCKEKKLRDFQLATAAFCKKMTDYLDENGLEYFITSGTLIGAVRHRGFIPWDDDFDIGLMRKDYEKLISLMKENFKCVDFSKIALSKNNRGKLINKALKESKGEEVVAYISPLYVKFYQGKSLKDCVFLDIFPHEYFVEDYTLEEHKKCARILNLEMEKLDSFPKIIEYLGNYIKTSSNVAEKSEKIYYSYDSFGTYVVNHDTFMSQDMIFPRRKMKFENYEFYAPNDPDGYIKVQYKNYMGLPTNFAIAPSFEDRIKH
ncbi:MAG: LicD family protein [Candidatus Gastranaerophilales bacterium]|nr:LicD family protein [Candidatus Gastranaerophilales bacterium]MCM1073680.1 LicD family protein [Bacteroides sp.]